MRQTSHSAPLPSFDHRKQLSARGELTGAGRALPGFLLLCAGALFGMLLSLNASQAAETNPLAPVVKICVFDFELEDASAGGGIIAQDSNDTSYLAQATEVAKRLLVGSGRYSLIDTKGADTEMAQKLGCGQAMIGLVNRITRMEYTLLIRVVDTRTGATVSNDFTDLRMGANDSWPRGVSWLMNKRVLAARAGK